jgi:CheY-like chemotaxis protein
LREICEEVSAAFRLRAEGKGIQFECTQDEGLPDRIWIDGLRLKQILYNVIGNAIKFTRKGKVTLHVTKSPWGDLSFVIKDTGLGITAEQAKKLFVPFQQADPSITREFGGTGLGLVLSKKLAHALGGDLKLTESSAQGTTFTVNVRLSEKQGLIAEQPTDYTPDALEKLNQKKILVVDDNPDNRILITKLLRPLNMQMQNAANGIEGMQKAQDWLPDVVLMDLQMPLMGGYEATVNLREKGFQQPIIALTANALKEEKEKCLNNGFDAYITKPIDKKIFFETLVQAVSPS